MKATSVRIDENTIERIDIKQAIVRFLDYEEWFVHEVQESLKELERGEVTKPAQVEDRFKKWGADASQTDTQGP